jgi:hypothetical protein
MHQILTQLPVRTSSELAVFEREMSTLTSGFSLRRSMAYTSFRMYVLQSHQTGSMCAMKFALIHNHVISVNDGVAVLYRTIDESSVVDPGDPVLDEASGNEHAKRAKHCNVLQ